MSEDFRRIIGSLAPQLEAAGLNPSRQFASAGPVSDAYIMSTGEMDLINGPVGSGKTTASIKRALLSATRMRPTDGRRRYVIGIWRHKYDALWSGTIPSWRRILDPDKGIGEWTGASPRKAEHKITFNDGWGPVDVIARFMAFGEAMGPEDLKSIEFTDVYLNEMDTLDETAQETLIGRVGRDPPEELSGRPGRIFGDCNSPSLNSWVYRDFWAERKPGYQLFRQPGGREPGAENLGAMGRGYYERMARQNAHRKWWVSAMVDNKPGYQRDADAVFEEYDDARMASDARVEADPLLPVLVGIDGGLTPAAVYAQEMPDGQLRILAEIWFERGDERQLADAMLALEARRFRGCEFYTVCDPAMKAGEDTDVGSMRTRLAAHLGRTVHLARTNVLQTRIDAVKAPLTRSLSGGRPGLLLSGPDCPLVREGFNSGYCWHRKSGVGERSSIADTRHTHTMDCVQYLAMETGKAHARHRQTEMKAQRMAKRAARARTGRYDPLARR